MASLTTTQGLLVRFDDTWLCITLTQRGDEFHFFRNAPINIYWLGQEIRVDDNGQQCFSHLRTYVVDDFGCLVEVPSGGGLSKQQAQPAALVGGV